MFHVKHRLKKLIKLSIWFSVAVYLANKFVESSAAFRHLLKAKKDGFYNWRHGKIYYTKTGSGSPLLLIHDLHPASSLQEWTKVIEMLAKDHTVYAVDLLGCGRSEKPNISSYCSYLYVQLVTDFIHEVIKEKTDVYATGKSGSFVVLAANMHSDIINEITLINPESFGRLAVLPDIRSRIAKAVLHFPLFGTFLYYQLVSRAQLEYQFTEKFFYNPFHLEDKTIFTYYEAAHLSQSGGRHLLAAICSNYMNFDIRYAFSKLENSIHIISGKNLPDAEKIAESYQKASCHVTCSYVDKTKMLPQLEAPKAFLRYISTQK